MSKKASKHKLRSAEWFGRNDRDAFVHRSWMKNQGFPHDLFDGRPVIGICNTWSEVTPCNAHFRELAEHVKAGVLEAGGFPLEFPVMSLGETVMRPTTMLFRNQVAMDVEESIRANPFDGIVLMMGCDKTTPALLMGAASCDLPTIGLSGGPMLNGKYRGEDIGSGTHVWKFTEALKIGTMKMADLPEAEACNARSAGHCMTMGTASTMAAMEASVAEGGVRLAGLQGEIDRLQQGIAALGAVNLAALDELAAASERKVFLDAQTADLQEAMNTLEDAIRKIDGETRQLLSGTFDAVNQHFGRMFPELFGGGNARLIVTGDEILDSGVQVMAQPPGKKNQTIHLLSGGEKALTAIALVFAIFQLNPAPFCLLDEVDAPLDDANTERYARLVMSMSTDTQFLFISHNKIAMV